MCWRRDEKVGGGNVALVGEGPFFLGVTGGAVCHVPVCSSTSHIYRTRAKNKNKKKIKEIKPVKMTSEQQ